MINGDAKIVKKSPSWPYIPGGDVCDVEDVDEDSKSKFKVDDSVVGSWNIVVVGGMAEMTHGHKARREKVPQPHPRGGRRHDQQTCQCLPGCSRDRDQIWRLPPHHCRSYGLGTSVVLLVRDANADRGDVHGRRPDEAPRCGRGGGLQQGQLAGVGAEGTRGGAVRRHH
ncbi:unnamed protein product [Discosporangium mesarthrocarpum]